jgi:hypothetical protein
MENVSSNCITNSANLDVDYNGTTDCRIDSFANTKSYKNEDNKVAYDNDEINVNIYRFKFTDEFTNELHNFSKIHQYDHRKDFKEAWNIWLEEQEEIVGLEVRRLTRLGYDGDILEKMFKSARYYFRKKGVQKKEPAKRRVYQGAQKELLDAMDDHITSNINDHDYKPSEGFDHFCKEHLDVVKEEVSHLCKNGFTDPQEIKTKIKKTYKNRYFLFISK